MGQAKQKAAAVAEWEKSLSPEERIVLNVARRLHEKFVMALGATGVCYRTSFFLSEYLAKEHGINVDTIVGFINDGEGDVMASHAWVEVSGKKIDLGLTLTEHPDAQPPGPLLILDRRFTQGRAIYTYHSERSPQALRAVERLLADLNLDAGMKEMLRYKEVEHETMQRIAKEKSFRQYLDAAPDGIDYEAMRKLIGG